MVASCPGRWNVRFRQFASVGLVVALTVVGFFVARALGDRGARRGSEHRAEIAATEIRGRLQQGAALAESLRRFMASGGATNEQLASVASRWLSPAGLQAAAWAERVPAARRSIYERRIGGRIVAAGPGGRL